MLTLKHMIYSEQLEVARVRCFLGGSDISHRPLWHTQDVPTFYKTVIFLDPHFGIVLVREEISASEGRYVATVTAKSGRLTRIGGDFPRVDE